MKLEGGIGEEWVGEIRSASQQLNLGWYPPSFPHPITVLSGSAGHSIPPTLLLLCWELHYFARHDQQQTFSTLSFLLNFSQNGATQLAKAEIMGFHLVRALGQPCGGWQRGSGRACHMTSTAGGPRGQNPRGILALSTFAFFEIHWNLTVKPTTISVPERLSSLGTSVAAVTLF